MRRLVPIAVFCAALAPVACGEDGSTTTTSSTDKARSAGSSPATIGQIPNLPPPKKSSSTSARAIAKRSEPKVTVPSGLPPKELLVGDLVTGTGARVEEKDQIGVRWVAYSYETGKLVENSWTLTRDTQLGAGEVNEGWERGLPGMRVGGLRELIVPSDLTRFGDEPLVYVVSLLWVK